jgi:uncharacterized protein
MLTMRKKTVLSLVLVVPALALTGFGSGFQAQNAGSGAVAPVAAAPAPGAPTPSFDCAADLTTIQQIICADPALAALDWELTHAVANAIARVPSAEVRAFRADQEAWQRELAGCVGASEPEACVGLALSARIVQLWERHSIGPNSVAMT